MTYGALGFEVAQLFAPERVRAAQSDIADHLDRLVSALYIPDAECAQAAPLHQRLDAIAARHRSYADLLRKAICTDAHRGPRLSSLAAAPDLHAAAERLAGVPLAGAIARVRASIGAFPEQAHPWHSDVVRIDDTGCGRVRIAAWIPLDDVAAGGGGLEVLAGRRRGPVPHLRTDQFSVEDATINGAGVVAPVVRAGEVLFLDRFTPHRTLLAADRARFALVVWFNTASQQDVDGRQDGA